MINHRTQETAWPSWFQKLPVVACATTIVDRAIAAAGGTITGGTAPISVHTFHTKRLPRTNENIVDLALVGDSGVGKTCVVQRFKQGWYTDPNMATFGDNLKVAHCAVNNKLLRLNVWDASGLESPRTGVHGFLVAYDTTNFTSFENVHRFWTREIDRYSTQGRSPPPVVLVGLKSDLPEQRAVSQNKGAQLAKVAGWDFMEVSSLSGENVDQAFNLLASKADQFKFWRDWDLCSFDEETVFRGVKLPLYS
jgi:small GTP-binding protein